MKIAVGTTSALKLRSVALALGQLEVDAEIIPFKARSGVPEQPFEYAEILEGSRNRAKKALKATGADIGIGIESGEVKIPHLGQHFDIPGVCVVTKKGEESFAFGAGYFVPDWMIKEVIKRDTDLGVIIQELDPSAEKDPIAYFSGNLIKREEMLTPAIVCALVKILLPKRYQGRDSI